MVRFFRFSFSLLFILGFVACKTINNTIASSNTLTLRAEGDLVGLNPVNHSGGTTLRIMKLILPSLVDFDPITLQFSPVLIDSLPQKLNQSDVTAYSFRFKDEASWPNGTPITVKDYVFSLKVAFNRKIRGNGWTRALSIIDKVVPDPNDDKACTIFLNKDIADALGYFAGFELLPEYHYDPTHLLAPFPLDDFIGVEAFDRLWTAHPEVTTFAQSFSQEKYIRAPEGVVGAGPYRLDHWDANDQIVLVKRKDYWGDGLKKKNLLLVGHPDTIIYKIIPDEVATTLMIKNKKLDVIPNISAGQFLKLKDDPAIAKNYSFYTPRSQATYLILTNTQSPKLDKGVRNALAHCIDLDQIIDAATSGLGKKATSPISHHSSYYNHELLPIKQDINHAQALLKNAGWTDKNADGFLQKQMDGNTVLLELDLIVGANPIGKSVGPVFKSAAQKIGVKVNIITIQGREMLSRLRGPNFELALIRLTTPPTEYMPYGFWHSDNAGQKGKNYTRFSVSEMDDIIKKLQLASTLEEKKKYYTQFQEVLYDEQPVIFLFSPVKTIIVHNKWKPLISSARPGYFENAFHLKEN